MENDLKNASNRSSSGMTAEAAHISIPGDSSPVVWYTVNPLSNVPRLPDSYPDDGTIWGSLDYIMAQGEYEPASFVVYPRKNVEKLTFKVSDFQ